MSNWEQSSDNKVCRELTYYNNGTMWSFIYDKETNKIKIYHSNDLYETQTKHKKTPNIPIDNLLWLINGSSKGEIEC
jgi:hypothetical protein